MSKVNNSYNAQLVGSEEMDRKAPAMNPVLDRGEVESLRKEIKGRIITPEDPGYEQGRAVFYSSFGHRPAAIVRVADSRDVARVISAARQSGVELAVRSGGHSFAGHSLTQGGIVIDLRDLRSLIIDHDARTAWAGTGLTTVEYTRATGEYGLATGFGDAGSVGIGGITLGGGIGYLVRKHGMTIDNLLAAEIVTADGQLRYVDAGHYPDLFWAIRGGGGNFGVATRFLYQLQEVDHILGGMLILPALPEVIAGFIAEAEAAPEELSTIANISSAPPMPNFPAELRGKMVLMAMMVYAGDVEAGTRAVAPFRKLAPPLVDMLRPMRYPEMYPPEQGGFHSATVGHTMFINQVDRSVAETILDNLEASTAPMRVAQLRVLGGAMARVPQDATAFAHRQSRIMANLAAFNYEEGEQPQHEAWVHRFASALDQGDPGAYVNFLGAEGEQRVHAAYPEDTWMRLADIKARYDPNNLFRRNQNIPPAR